MSTENQKQNFEFQFFYSADKFQYEQINSRDLILKNMANNIIKCSRFPMN